MAYGAAAVAVVGTIISIQGEKKRARAEQRAALQNAETKRLQALELLDRFEINADKLAIEGEQVKGQQLSQISGRGISINSNAALNLIEETNSLLAREYALRKREVTHQAEMIRRGADIDVETASNIRSASRIRQTGMFLQGAGQAYSAGSAAS